MKLLVAPFRHAPHNVCRSVIFPMPQAPTQKLPLPFARFSFLAKFLIAFLAFLCSFQGAFLKYLLFNFCCLSFSSNLFRFSDPFRLLQLSDPSKRYRVISEELTNLSILLFAGLYPAQMRFAFAPSPSACCTLLFQLFSY